MRFGLFDRLRHMNGWAKLPSRRPGAGRWRAGPQAEERIFRDALPRIMNTDPLEYRRLIDGG